MGKQPESRRDSLEVIPRSKSEHESQSGHFRQSRPTASTTNASKAEGSGAGGGAALKETNMTTELKSQKLQVLEVVTTPRDRMMSAWWNELVEISYVYRNVQLKRSIKIEKLFC